MVDLVLIDEDDGDDDEEENAVAYTTLLPLNFFFSVKSLE